MAGNLPVEPASGRFKQAGRLLYPERLDLSGQTLVKQPVLFPDRSIGRRQPMIHW